MAAKRGDDEKVQTVYDATIEAYEKITYTFFYIGSNGYYTDTCKLKDEPYGIELKRISKIFLKLHNAVRNAPRKYCQYRAKITADDISCDFYDIDPYLDSNGTRHSQIHFFKVYVPLSAYELALNPFSEIGGYEYNIRFERIENKNYSNRKISILKCSCQYGVVFGRKLTPVMDFSITGTGNWIFGKATPHIWEKAEFLKD